jgi:hypothetical protein
VSGWFPSEDLHDCSVDMPASIEKCEVQLVGEVAGLSRRRSCSKLRNPMVGPSRFVRMVNALSCETTLSAGSPDHSPRRTPDRAPKLRPASFVSDQVKADSA